MPNPDHRLNRAELARLNRQITIDPSGCWLWTGPKNTNGYAFASRGPGHTKKVIHRTLWEHYNDQVIPEGMQLDHLCRVRHCVNPEHFEVVTPSVNTLRQDHGNRRKTHCPQGHEYNEQNTRINSKGKRICRACDNARKSMRTGAASADGEAPASDGVQMRGPGETPISRQKD
jgi:HNH endonuclease